MNKYYNKYIKYKLKYLKLLKGGSDEYNIIKLNSEQLKKNDFYTIFQLLKWLRESYSKQEYYNTKYFNTKYFILSIENTIIYSPCYKNISQSSKPLIYEYVNHHINQRNLWFNFYVRNDRGDIILNNIYDTDIVENFLIYDILEKSNLKFVNSPEIILTIIPADDLIWDMYSDYISSSKMGYINFKLTQPSDYFEDIIIYIKLSDNIEKLEELINKIERMSNDEDKEIAYMSTVKNLLDPLTAKDSIKKIIKKCPWAIKGLDEVNCDDSIINIFFEIIFDEKYLYKIREPYYMSIIPKYKLKDVKLIDTIITKIIDEFTSNATYKKYCIKLLTYACGENIINTRFNLSTHPLSELLEKDLFYTKSTKMRELDIIMIRLDDLNKNINILIQSLNDMTNTFTLSKKYYIMYESNFIYIPFLLIADQSTILNLGNTTFAHDWVDNKLLSKLNTDCNNITLHIIVLNNQIIHASLIQYKNETKILYDFRNIEPENKQNIIFFKDIINNCLSKQNDFNIKCIILAYTKDLKVITNHITYITICNAIKPDGSVLENNILINNLSYDDTNISQEYMGAGKIIEKILLYIMKYNNTKDIKINNVCEIQNRIIALNSTEFVQCLGKLDSHKDPGNISQELLDLSNTKYINFISKNIKGSCGTIAFIYKCFYIFNDHIKDKNIIHNYLNFLDNCTLIKLIVYYQSYINNIIMSFIHTSNDLVLINTISNLTDKFGFPHNLPYSIKFPSLENMVKLGVLH